MKKIISFCLFGDNPLYIEGAIQNAIAAKELYQNWQCYYYVDNDLDSKVIETLLTLGAKIRIIHEAYHTDTESLARKMYWRLYALEESCAERIIFRDCDSRLSLKEKYAVDAWEQSDKDFHFMYDHKLHTTHIMGGMWGVKSGIIKNIKLKIAHFFEINSKKSSNYSTICDQSFLKEIVWQKYVTTNNYIAHGNYEMCDYHIKNEIKICSYPGNYTEQTNNGHFIGQVVKVPGAKDKPNKLAIN